MTFPLCTRAMTIAVITAVVVTGFSLTGCGRVADRFDGTPASTPSSTNQAVSNADALEHVKDLLDEADSAVSDASDEAAEGDRAATVDDEP